MRFSGSGLNGPVAAFLAIVLLGFVAVGTSLASSGESGGGGITVIPDASAIIQIANFIVLILVLNFLLYRPIRKVIQQRKEKIQGLELSIETSGESAEEKELAFIQGIKDARAKGMREKDALLQEAGEEEKRIIEEKNEEAQAELAEVRSKIAVDVESTREALSKQIDAFADEISKKILGRSI